MRRQMKLTREILQRFAEPSKPVVWRHELVLQLARQAVDSWSRANRHEPMFDTSDQILEQIRAGEDGRACH